MTYYLGKQALMWHMQTYHIGAFGLEGVGAAGVEMRVVVALQEADVVEAFGLWRREKELLECCCFVLFYGEAFSFQYSNTSSEI